MDRRTRHDRVSTPADRDRRAPATRPPRRPRDHRGDPPVYPRVRPGRRDNEHGPRTLRPGPRALSQPHQPRCTLDLGAGNQPIDMTRRDAVSVNTVPEPPAPGMNRFIEIPEYEIHTEVRVDPSQTALVVVDMQNDFVHQGGSLLVPDAEATIPAINRLLQFARAHGMRVVYSQDTHRDGDPEWRIWPERAREGT